VVTEGILLPNGSCSGRIVADVVVSLHKARKRLRTGKLKEPRIVRQLALAEEFLALLDAGKVNQSGLAHLYGLTRARVTHILNLLKLQPAIPAYLRQAGRFTNRVSERALRSLSRDHKAQRELATLLRDAAKRSA
jgi:hypothetical protein